MGITQKDRVIIHIEGFGIGVMTPDDHLERYTADARKGQHRVGYLSHALLQLADLGDTLRAGDVEQHQ